MPSYYIWTIGCQMNKAESEKLAGHLENLGYLPSFRVEEADLILLNSCVVRQSAENRVINKLHSLKAIKNARPQITIALTGCIVGTDLNDLKRSFPYIDHFFGPGKFPEWLGEFKPSHVLPRTTLVTAYVPIMQGCNNFCSYCVVPYRRGRETSRPLDEIIYEVKGLVRKGVKEVTLLGQNVNSYGNNLPGHPDLADLLSELNSLEGLLRIRFLTNHPKDMKNKLIEAVASLDKVCEQINLPVQSGDNDILKAMHRGYTADYYRQLVSEIRIKIPGISLSTDVIVGFPGETEKQFQNTFDLLSDIKFDMVHVAAYSPRPETLAAREMKDDVTFETKKKRLEMVEQLQSGIIGDINSRLRDQNVEILVEGQKNGKWMGRTRTDKLVYFNQTGQFCSSLVIIKITRTTPWSLGGNIISD